MSKTKDHFTLARKKIIHMQNIIFTILHFHCINKNLILGNIINVTIQNLFIISNFKGFEKEFTIIKRKNKFKST